MRSDTEGRLHAAATHDGGHDEDANYDADDFDVAASFDVNALDVLRLVLLDGGRLR